MLIVVVESFATRSFRLKIQTTMAKLIVANWKMNPQTQKEAERILADYLKLLQTKNYKTKTDIVVCPPFVYLPLLSVISHKSSVKLGAQDVFWEKGGAFTGEISSGMLGDLKCKYAIIGHSERRKFLGETDEMVNKKVVSALKAGLNIILCVGEHHRENMSEIPKIVEDQVAVALSGVQKSYIGKITIAYEPVWAIGTGAPDTPEGAMMAAVLIRKTAVNVLGYAGKDLRVLYGGSVKSLNSGEFINHEGIDGVLVGGASLDPEEFVKIILSAGNK